MHQTLGLDPGVPRFSPVAAKKKPPGGKISKSRGSKIRSPKCFNLENRIQRHLLSTGGSGDRIPGLPGDLFPNGFGLPKTDAWGRVKSAFLTEPDSVKPYKQKGKNVF
ncbi:hypothetical protein JTB14_012552 [Gonioctena quinquepunctata]|nr:hypothetical protein JTB14_012552 [Gonioctena quinquepunctata]